MDPARSDAFEPSPSTQHARTYDIPPEEIALRSMLGIDQGLTAAEWKWLREESVIDNSSGKERYDWRERASSQIKAKRETRNRFFPPIVPSLEGQPFFHEVQAYRERFLPLLDYEQEEAELVIKERLSQWSPQRLQEEGYCLTGLSAFWLTATQTGRPIAAFTLGPGKLLPWHRFDNGAQVLVSKLDPLAEKPCKGSVVSHTATQVRISFDSQVDLEYDMWRLDLGQSDISYRRMRAAIDLLYADPAVQERESTPKHEYILQGTYLRDVFLKSFSESSSNDQPNSPKYSPSESANRGVFANNQLIQSWARRYREPNPVVVEGDPALHLNKTQIRAVAQMVGERVSLVQGPPGTGKTRTIVEAIKLLKQHFQVVHPLLVCTYTNVAVDNLVEGLVAAGLKPLRVGPLGKVKDTLLSYSLDALIAKHPLKKQIDECEGNIKSIEEKIKNIHQSPSWPNHRLQSRVSAMGRQVSMVWAKVYGLQRSMLHDIIQKADVICTTCISSVCSDLKGVDFPVVFLDEASMSTEPASLIPLMKGITKSKHLALIGDHQQLPPIITSSAAKAGGLGLSLFERLTEEGDIPSTMLNIQYRMHPDISRFPSLEFYNFALRDGTIDNMGRVSPLLLPPASEHFVPDPETGHRPSVIFLDHVGQEARKDRSRVNRDEVKIVCSVITDLLLNNLDVGGKDIGVIAPYAAQISLLERTLRVDPKWRKQFIADLGEFRAMELASIEVKTVDGFEGREKEIILFSTVRNNEAGHIGFLADRRRLNVGLTRAKRGLFIIGSLDTLRAGKEPQSGTSAARNKGAMAWRRYMQFLTEQNLVIKVKNLASQVPA